MNRLSSVVKEGFEIEPGKRYVIFLDPSIVNIQALLNDRCESDVQIIPVMLRQGATVAESVAVFALEENEIVPA